MQPNPSFLYLVVCSFIHRQRGCETPSDVEAVVTRRRQQAPKATRRSETLSRSLYLDTNCINQFIWERSEILFVLKMLFGSM